MTIETNGLSSAKILDFYKGCDFYKISNHALMITKDGRKLFEHYIYPFSAKMPHTLFSVTKSLVSTAVGFAIDEGLISLDTKIFQYFTDYAQSKGTEKITVRDLLTMHSGKKFSFLQDMTGDYVEIFMKSGFRKENGFLYSNNDVHILSAMLQRITKIPVVDYLMPRLFTPLGIDKPEWETDCNGVCVGGTGAYLTLGSLVKIMQCYLDGGKYEGKQIIPEFWTKEATQKHIELDAKKPSENGYGYLFWTYRDFFCMNGLYGQIIAGYPKLNVVIAYMDCAISDVPLFKLTREHLLKAFVEKDNEHDNKLLEEYLTAKDEKVIEKSERGIVPNGEFKISAFSKITAQLFFPALLIPRSITSSMAKRPKTSFDRFSFSQADDEITVKWYEEEDAVVVKCGLDGTPRLSECTIKGYKYILWSYGWWDGKTLNIKLRPINTLSSLEMEFNFKDNGFGLRIDETPNFEDFILNNLNQVEILAKNNFLKSAAAGIMKFLLKTLKMEIKFKK